METGEPKPRTLEKKEKILYTGFFVLTPKELAKKFPPKHNRVFAHHVTISFKPKDLDGIELGKRAQIKIIARVSDDKGDALLVENNLKSDFKHPHITLSCAEGVMPVYSNEMIEKAIESNTIEYLENPVTIETMEGYVSGKGKEIFSKYGKSAEESLARENEIVAELYSKDTRGE